MVGNQYEFSKYFYTQYLAANYTCQPLIMGGGAATGGLAPGLCVPLQVGCKLIDQCMMCTHACGHGNAARWLVQPELGPVWAQHRGSSQGCANFTHVLFQPLDWGPLRGHMAPTHKPQLAGHLGPTPRQQILIRCGCTPLPASWGAALQQDCSQTQAEIRF